MNEQKPINRLYLRLRSIAKRYNKGKQSFFITQTCIVISQLPNNLLNTGF